MRGGSPHLGSSFSHSWGAQQGRFWYLITFSSLHPHRTRGEISNQSLDKFQEEETSN